MSREFQVQNCVFCVTMPIAVFIVSVCYELIHHCVTVIAATVITAGVVCLRHVPFLHILATPGI